MAVFREALKKKIKKVLKFFFYAILINFRHNFFYEFFGGLPPTLQFLKVFLTSKGENFFFFQNWPKSGLVSEKTRRKVLNFSGNRGGGYGVSPKLKYFSFFVFLLLKASLKSKKKS